MATKTTGKKETWVNFTAIIGNQAYVLKLPNKSFLKVILAADFQKIHIMTGEGGRKHMVVV